MANHAASKKSIRQIERRTVVNNDRRTRTRTFVRKVEEAIDAGNQADAVAALKAAQPEMMRSAQRGVFHRNTVSRKISRLSARIKAMAA